MGCAHGLEDRSRTSPPKADLTHRCRGGEGEWRGRISVADYDGTVSAARFNSDGNYCLSYGKDRTICLWNRRPGIHVKTYKSHGRTGRPRCPCTLLCRFSLHLYLL